MADVAAELAKAMHDERDEKNSRNVDCWACAAAQSDSIGRILTRLQEAEAAASHTDAVLIRAIPDEDTRAALWRDYWRDQLTKLQGADR